MPVRRRTAVLDCGFVSACGQCRHSGASTVGQRSRRHAAHVTFAHLGILSRTWNRKRKRYAWTIVWGSPHAATMILNDRATDREADSHTIVFGCVESLEYPVK